MKEATLAELPEAIFKYVSDAIVVLDDRGFIVNVNSSIEPLIGYSAEELINKVKLADLCQGMGSSPEFTACSNCYATLESRASFEMRLLHKNGQICSVAASATRLPRQHKGLLIMVLRDVSEDYRQKEEHFQKKLTNYVMQAQEAERKRVSRDLHDGVGQTMYSMIVGLNMMEQFCPTDTLQDNFRSVKELAIQALEEVRNIAVELRPCSLDDWGLLPALRSFIKQFERTYGILTNLNAIGSERRYGAAIETALYRICQEAMINAAKYANIDKLEICFEEHDQQLYLTVTDLGRGFDLENIEIQGSGLGLYGMRERAQLIGGTLNVTSSIGQGTVVSVCVPLDKEEDAAK